MTTKAIVIQSVSRRFGRTEVLRGVDLAVADGETVALVGDNGSGKTTLIEILATVLQPTAGCAAIHGFDVVTATRDVQGRVGYAPSNLQSFYPRLSGIRNLVFFAALYGMTGPRASRRVEALLERLGLTAAAATPYERYSDGMKARLVLARALLHDPAVVLLDEPTRSIDATFRDELRSLWRLCDDGRARTALWVTHDRAELRHADRVVRLAGGRLQDASVPHGLTRADEESPLTAHAGDRLARAAS